MPEKHSYIKLIFIDYYIDMSELKITLNIPIYVKTFQIDGQQHKNKQYMLFLDIHIQ